MKLSLFHSSTTVARGTSQIITGIPDSHHGCFVITPLIRVPNWLLIAHEISNNWRKLHCMMQKNPKSSDIGSTEEQKKHRILANYAMSPTWLLLTKRSHLSRTGEALLIHDRRRGPTRGRKNPALLICLPFTRDGRRVCDGIVRMI